MFLSLFTSRVILQALGVNDLGIVNVVGGVVGLMTLINSSMSLSVQRFIAYDLGKRDNTQLNVTFCISFIVHIMIALTVFLLGETLGLYFLQNFIQYPANRSNAVMWVYQLSLLSTCIGITQIPYSALIVAYEKMGAFAYLSILDVLLRLLLIYTLLVTPYDKLICYSLFGFIVSLLMMAIHWIYCIRVFRNVRFRWIWRKAEALRLFDFAGWSTFGELAWLGTNQGVTIVINIFFGTAVNAARGISFQIKGAVMRFIAAFQTAMNPQIIKLYANGEFVKMKNLVNRGTCYSFYLALLLSLPIILKTDYLIYLWLGQVPDYLVLFTQLVLLNVMFDMLSNLLATVAKAQGNIKRYQITVTMLLALNFPITYGLYAMGCAPYSAYVVYGCVSIGLLFVRLLLLKRMVGLSVFAYVREVLIPITLVSFAAIPLPILTKMYYSQNAFLDCVIVSTTSVLSVAVAVYVLGLRQQERNMLKTKIITFLVSKKR